MYRCIRPALLAGLVWNLALAAPAWADAATSPAGTTLIGVVKAAPVGAAEAATVLVNKVLYRIVKDAKGQIVARDAAGKKAELRGTVEDRHGEPWITVTWCALVE